MSSVSVLGTGAIGAAVARALMKAGYVVTVWNRSVEPTKALAEDGANVASSAVEAASASELTIVCLSGMEASRAVLMNAEMATALTGKTIAQVTSATIEDTMLEARWAEKHAIGYLNGFMLSFPRGIGTTHGLIFMAGQLAVFERHQATLSSVAAVQHVGEDLGRAGIFFTCAVWIHYASLYGLLHAAAYAEAHGVAMTDVITAGGGAMTRFVDEALEEECRRIQSRDYSGDEATLTTHLGALDYVLDLPGMTAAGIDLGFAPALKDLMERAVQNGDGDKDIAALFEQVRG